MCYRLSWPHTAFQSTLNSCIVSYRIIQNWDLCLLLTEPLFTLKLYTKCLAILRFCKQMTLLISIRDFMPEIRSWPNSNMTGNSCERIGDPVFPIPFLLLYMLSKVYLLLISWKSCCNRWNLEAYHSMACILLPVLLFSHCHVYALPSSAGKLSAGDKEWRGGLFEKLFNAYCVVMFLKLSIENYFARCLITHTHCLHPILPQQRPLTAVTKKSRTQCRTKSHRTLTLKNLF